MHRLPLGILATTPAAHANLLLNGGFENPGYLLGAGTFNGSTGYYVELYTGSTAIDHWTVLGAPATKSVNWNQHVVNEGQEGNYSLFFSPNGYINNFVAQTFPTAPGQAYDVDLMVTTQVGTELLQVSADGQDQVFEVLGVTPVWQAIHWQFIADDTTATLMLGKIGNGTLGSPGFVLDAASVVAASAVPEASTTLGATGLVGLVIGMLARRRHLAR